MPEIKSQEELLIDSKVFPTALSSKDIQFYWSEQLREKALFSAKTTSKEYLDRVKELLIDYQRGFGKTTDGTDRPISQGLGRTRMLMLEKLNELGLVERNDKGAVKETMTNLGSKIRLELVIKTNVGQAHSLHQKMLAQDPIQKIIRPYFELVRNEQRKIPRKWKERWDECCKVIDYEGVVLGTDRFIARTDSPIWAELGHHYSDCLGVDTPPFCFGSGMGWRTVKQKEIDRLGLKVGGKNVQDKD